MNSKNVEPCVTKMSDRKNGVLVDDQVARALEEYAASIEKGQPVSRESLLEKHAGISEELAGCLDSLEFIRDVAPQMEDQRHNSDEVTGQETAQRRVTVGDYRIVREIGRGGMGVVYEAEQLSLGRSVALKVLPYAAMMDQKAITRFKNEARAAATLDHPHIVPVFAVGIERGIHYYAMSLINGLTVADLISQLQRSITNAGSIDPVSIDKFLSGHGDPSEKASAVRLEPTIDCGQLTKKSAAGTIRHADETHRDVEAAVSTQHSRFDRPFFSSVARLGAQAAEALDHAHQHGIVHRDIKPGNLMIDCGTKLWVADFGLARIESDAGVTMTGDLVGTLRYMAPEQALAQRVVVDHRVDIYSLGASLYELLALNPALDGPDRETLLRQIAFEDPKPLAQANRAVPHDLRTIVHKALSKHPDDRYQTAAEMANDLHAFVDDEPIKARPLSIAQRTTRWLAKRKGLVASVVAALIFTVIGLLISNTLIVRQRNEAQAAEAKERAARWKADINAKLAREAVDTYLTKISEHRLLNEPSMRPLRKELLMQALRYYSELVGNQPDDPDMKTELADAYFRAGKITREIGSLRESTDLFLVSLQSRKNLLAKKPESLDCQLNVAISKRELASVYAAAGMREEALYYAEDAISTCEQLVRQKPYRMNWQYDLALCYSTLCSVHMDSGSYNAALSIAQPSIATMESLAQHSNAYLEDHGYHHPMALAWKSDLSGAYTNAGLAQWKLGRSDEAVNSFRRSIEILERLAGENPRISRHQSNLGTAYHNLASIHSQLLETDDALDLFQKAITIRKRLANENPDVHEYQRSLAASLNGVGSLHLKLGMTDNASESLTGGEKGSEEKKGQEPNW